jgi:hypothetical protein
MEAATASPRRRGSRIASNSVTSSPNTSQTGSRQHPSSKIYRESMTTIGPMITSSYIEDLSSLWTEVHPALLEVNAQNYSVFAGSVVDPSMCRLLDGSNRSSTTDQIIIARRHCTTPRSHSGVTRASCSIGKEGSTEPAMFSIMRANNVSTSQPPPRTNLTHNSPT